MASRTSPLPQPPPPDIAREAYADAIAYLKKEFAHNAEMLTWVNNISSTTIDDLLVTVFEAESKYLDDPKRQQGVRKWSGKLSKTVMQYADVFDALAKHHPELISLLWGVTKFILRGIINHGKLVIQLSEALATIASVLPTAKLTVELYRTDEMKSAVSSLYAHVLLFLKRILMKWYQAGPGGRALFAVFNPFETSYKPLLQQVEQCAQTIDKIAGLYVKQEVREISDTSRDIKDASNQHTKALARINNTLLDMQRRSEADIAKVLQIVGCSGSKIDQIHVGVGDIKPRIFDMHFKDMMDILKPITAPDQALQSHRSLIRRVTPRSTPSPEDARVLRIISNWAQRPQAPLLVLQAEPRAQARVKRLAVEVISLLKPQAQQVVWYLSGISADEVGKASTAEVLRTLVVQLMSLAPDIVTAHPDRFNAAKLAAPHSDEEWLCLLCWLLGHVPACFVVIEAEDVMRNEAGEATSDTGSAVGLMAMFKRLACELDEQAGGRVKLLVVNYRRSQDLQETPQATVLNIRGEVPAATIRRRRTMATHRGGGRMRFT